VPITIKVESLNPTDGEVYSIQLYVIKFVSDLRQVCGFLRVLQFPPPIKLTTTMLKVALNTITPRFVQMKVPGAFDESPWGQELKILKFI
jgi:hypothetical protein